MATGMKTWIGLVATGAALIAILALPPSDLTPERLQRPKIAEEIRERTLEDEFRAKAGILQRLRWSDRYVAEALAHDGPVAFGVPEPPPLDRILQMVRPEARRAAARDWRRNGPERLAQIERSTVSRLEAELERDGLTEPGVALGFFLVEGNEGAYKRYGVSRLGRGQEYFWGTAVDGRPYCVTVEAVWFSPGGIRYGAPARPKNALGACQLIAAHGLPGPAVEGWLADGGTAFATASTPWDPSRPHPYKDVQARRGKYGLAVGRDVVATGAEVDLCMAGREEGCGAMLSDPRDRYYFPQRGLYAAIRDASPLSAAEGGSALEVVDPHVLADLRAEFGPERFQRFWTHGGTFEEAFADAFGVRHGEWNLKRVSGLLPITRPGPALAAGTWRLGFTLVLVLGLIAGLRARKVTVA